MELENREKPYEGLFLALVRNDRGKTEGGKHFLFFIVAVLFLLGAGLTIYALFLTDFNSTFLGLGIMLISLIFGFIFTKANQRHYIRHVYRTHHKKKGTEIKIIRKFKFPRAIIDFRLILFILFFMLGAAASAYFIICTKDYIFLGLSGVIVILSLMGIIIVIRRAKTKRGHEKGLGKFVVAEHVKGIKGQKIEKGVKEKKEEIQISTDEISKLSRIVKGKLKELSKDKTPLDVLYWLLEEKKRLKFNNISKIFGIEIKRVEEWAKILENHEMAKVIYPAFGNPILQINKKESLKEGKEGKKVKKSKKE